MERGIRLEQVILGDQTAVDIVPFTRGGQGDDELKLSLGRKVSPTGWYQELKSRWVPTTPNSFGLPAGTTCPGRTPFCNDCYAGGSENMRGVAELLEHNYRLLQEVETVEGMTELLTKAVARYVFEADRKEIPDRDRFFRIHWDGDFFSEDYARAWANTMELFPDLQFWAYTRSFTEAVNVVPILAPVSNLSLYLSADQYNGTLAEAVVSEYPNVHLARCAEDYEQAREIAPERKSVICPENLGRMALMTNGRGACVDCRICVDGKRDVLFSTTHREIADPQLKLFEDPSITLVALGPTRRTEATANVTRTDDSVQQNALFGEAV